MNKIKYFFAAMTLAVLVTSCAKEDISPEATTPFSDEAQELTEDFESLDFITLEDGLLADETSILNALGIEDDAATSRSNFRPVIYTLSNEASGNEVIVFKSNANGTINETARYATGGTGTDGGLGNQSALAFNRSQRFLYAVNPGSNEISFFVANPNGNLTLMDRINSGGIRPVSVTEYRGVIYVLNAGSDNIAGFTHNRFGRLAPLSNSTRSLSSTGTNPAQISFSRNGRVLIVTEKATNTISTFPVSYTGRPGALNTTTSVGAVPFGFSLGQGNSFVVSEPGGTGQGSVVSSYRVNNQGQVTLIDGPLQLGTAGACWVAITQNIRTAFIMNTGSDNISSLSLTPGMQLGLSNNGNNTTAFDGPLDGALDKNSRYLYVLGGGNDAIISYRVGANGQLTQIDLDGGLPNRATGIVVKN